MISGSPLPAHQTKSLAELSYQIWENEIIKLNQIDSVTDSTGRTVWLGAQVRLLFDELATKDTTDEIH
jgi:hypothetical protein